MNINLVSPDGNGHTYSVRFQDQIIIPQNSQIYMNFASLSREGNVRFTEDQKLGIECFHTNVLPTHQSGGAIENKPFNPTDSPNSDNEATIPKGVYSYKELSALINTSLNSILNANVAVAEMDTYVPVNSQNLLDPDYDFVAGLKRKPERSGTFIPFVANATHAFNNGTNDGTNDVVFCKNNVNDETTVGGVDYRNWSSYALSSISYNHLGYGDDGTPIKYLNMIHATTNKTPTEFIAADAQVSIGLYSEEVATGYSATGLAAPLINDDTSRTRGSDNTVAGIVNLPKQFIRLNNTSQVKTDDPAGNVREIAGFFQVSIDGTGTTCKYKITTCRKTGANNSLENFTANSEVIAKMVGAGAGAPPNVVESGSGRGLVKDADTKMSIGIQTYYDNKDPSFPANGRGKLHIRVWAFQDGIDTDKSIQENDGILVYQSKDKNTIPDNFFVSSQGIDYTTGNAAAQLVKNKGQIPLSVMVASTTQNFGWEKCDYCGFDKTKADYATIPKSLLTSYFLSATPDLGIILKFANRTVDGENVVRNNVERLLSEKLYPNSLNINNGLVFHLKNMSLDWVNQSYSITIPNLPIKNFKNTDTNKKGGYSSAILANVPAPFQESQIGDDNLLTTAVYKPNYQVITNMYNEQVSTNKFDVEIKDLKNDVPAVDLQRSIVNMTITPPDTWKGNLNSVVPLL